MKLKEFYEQVDSAVGKLAEFHAARLNCKKGCAACCTDDLTVFVIEAENIRAGHAALLANEAPHETGACAFLDKENACRIYENRPYFCRTQGLPIRWFEEGFKEIVEYRDICPLNEAGEPVETLDADKCWTLGEFEEKLARMQIEFSTSDNCRIALRDLFQEIRRAENC